VSFSLYTKSFLDPEFTRTCDSTFCWPFPFDKIIFQYITFRLNFSSRMRKKKIVCFETDVKWCAGTFFILFPNTPDVNMPNNDEFKFSLFGCGSFVRFFF